MTLIPVAAVAHNGARSVPLLVTATLQVIYCIKFFIWEVAACVCCGAPLDDGKMALGVQSGYYATIDIMHDRAGFYTQWGTMVWVPMAYTLPTLYAAHSLHSLDPNWCMVCFACENMRGKYRQMEVVLSTFAAQLVLVFGIVMTVLNYDVDAHRQAVRNHGPENVLLWRQPVQVGVACPLYTGFLHRFAQVLRDNRGRFLLVSGWWSVARHINYFFELMLAYSWGMCSGLAVLPYFYAIFLTGLLIHRYATPSGLVMGASTCPPVTCPRCAGHSETISVASLSMVNCGYNTLIVSHAD